MSTYSRYNGPSGYADDMMDLNSSAWPQEDEATGLEPILMIRQPSFSVLDDIRNDKTIHYEEDNDDNDEDVDNTSTEDSEIVDYATNNMFTITDSNDLTPDDWTAFDKMISYSFSSIITKDTNLMEALRECYVKFSEFCVSNRNNMNNIRMKSLLVVASQAYGINIDKINRAKEERLCFEAVALLLFSRKDYLYNSENFIITKEEFLISYPDYTAQHIGPEESASLLEFRNLMKIAMYLIPPLHNKNHLLDLVTRMIEGKDVRHVTGTGATKATRLRVSIILKEGNLVVPKRPPRLGSQQTVLSKKSKKSSVSRSAIKFKILTQPVSQPASSNEVKRKRGRPRKDSEVFDEESVKRTKVTDTSYDLAVDVMDSLKTANVPTPFSVPTKHPMSVLLRQMSDDNILEFPVGDESGLFPRFLSDSLPLPMTSLERSSSIENWTNVDIFGVKDQLQFKPELLRQTSFFHHLNGDSSIDNSIMEG